MGTVKLEFIGLFLFHRWTDDEMRVAAIHANRQGVRHKERALTPHVAYFEILHGDYDNRGWEPFHGIGHGFALAGKIELPKTQPGPIDVGRWRVPRLEGVTIDRAFFEVDSGKGMKHAVIHLPRGSLCSWRVTEKGAINTRVTIDGVAEFSLSRKRGYEQIVFTDLSKPVEIHFRNTDVRTGDDYDWYWYYEATRTDGDTLPVDGSRHPCDAPPSVKPLTIGCSNSTWP